MPKASSQKRQMELPGVFLVPGTGRSVRTCGARIPLLELLDALDSPEGRRGLVEIYRSEVLPARTRTVPLLGRKCTARILHTLLGFEVKAAFKRILCPDHVTARYLRIFSELGCDTIRLPYDPTVTARIIGELESAHARLLAGIEELIPRSRTLRLYVLRGVLRHLRNRLRVE